MSDPRKLTDLRLMQIKEKMLHGEFVYSHGLDLLDHIAALSAELAQVRGELESGRELFAALAKTAPLTRDAATALTTERDQARAERDRYDKKPYPDTYCEKHDEAFIGNCGPCEKERREREEAYETKLAKLAKKAYAIQNAEIDSLRSALSAAEEKLEVAREALKKILHEADTERELRGDPPHPTIEMGREALAKMGEKT